MKYFDLRRFLVFCHVALILAPLQSIQATLQRQTELVLSDLALQSGTTGIVSARLECGASFCAAFDLILTFEPEVVQVDNIGLGNYLGSVERAEALELIAEVDNLTGSVHLAAVSVGLPTVQPEANLFYLEVTALRRGNTQFEATQLEVADANATKLMSHVSGGRISVSDAISPSPTTTQSPTSTVQSPDTQNVQICLAVVSEQSVPVHVGPGEIRPVRGSLVQNETVPITGQAVDSDGTTWWRIQPEDFAPGEDNRYWIRQDDVSTSGMCSTVETAEPPPIVRAPTAQSATADASDMLSPICNPGEWNGQCGSNSCPSDHVSQCNAEGLGWTCVWNPGQCLSPTRFVCTQALFDEVIFWLRSDTRTSPPAPGHVDLNQDGVIDGKDYVICLKNYVADG